MKFLLIKSETEEHNSFPIVIDKSNTIENLLERIDTYRQVNMVAGGCDPLYKSKHFIKFSTKDEGTTLIELNNIVLENLNNRFCTSVPPVKQRPKLKIQQWELI